MKNLSLEDALICNTARLIGAVLRAMPEGAALGVARACGRFYSFTAKRRSIALKNATGVFPRLSGRERRVLVRRNFEHLFMNAAELLRAPRMNESYVEKHVRVIGDEKIREYVAKKRGVILVTAHFGNWEMLNLVGGIRNYPMSVFARAQKHPRSNDFLNSLRASKGAQIVYKGVSARGILAALRAGRVVGMLADQDAGKSGVFFDFFGRSSSWPRGVARFARMANVPIIPVVDIRVSQGPGHRIVCGDEIRVDSALDDEAAERAVITRFIEFLEKNIREHPGQWLWPHRRWKSSPDRTVLVLSDKKAGHVKQSEAFAEAVRSARAARGVAAERTTVKTAVIEYRSPFWKSVLIAWGVLTGGRFPFRRRLLELALGETCADELESAAPDYIVSCGSGTEAVNLMLKQEFGARSCAIQKPQFGLSRFDVVIAPKHDRMGDSEKVFRIGGAVVWAAGASSGTEPDPGGIGFLVGGPTDQIRWNGHFAENTSKAIRAAAEKAGGCVYVTSSRRTPKEAEDALNRNFGSWNGCKSLVIVSRENPAGAYAGILEKSRVIVATADSVSMISEALEARRRVIAVVPDSSGDGKMERFLTNLSAAGRLRTSSAAGLESVIAEELAAPLVRGEFSPDRDALMLAADKLTGEKSR